MATLEITGLNFAYETQGAWALRELALKVEAAEIVCILGASGCGKSTLLNLIAGLLQPTSGNISVKQDAQTSTRIGYIFQQDALFPWRTVEKNLMLATDVGAVKREDAQARMKDYLKAFHLADDILKKYPSQLSGGMRQRASIIQSLMFNPELLLLDEPFSALDFYTKLRLEDEFYQLVKTQRKAAVLVTHDIEEAIAMAGRILLMNKSGAFTSEFTIDLGAQRVPESVRGTAAFADYYSTIWSQLKAVIADA